MFSFTEIRMSFSVIPMFMTIHSKYGKVLPPMSEYADDVLLPMPYSRHFDKDHSKRLPRISRTSFPQIGSIEP
jgi:hypothetical protein